MSYVSGFWSSGCRVWGLGFRVQGVVQHSLLTHLTPSGFNASELKCRLDEEGVVFANEFFISETHIDSD